MGAKIKAKTNSGAAKRFRVTATGKIKRKKNNLRHILTTHPRKVKRRYRKKAYIAAADEARVKLLLPNHF